MANLTTTISESNHCATFISSFTTSSYQQQDELVKMLVDTTEKVMKHQPGFISVNIHKSYDGTEVVNYEQWHSSEYLWAAVQKPEAIEHIKEICKIFKPEGTVYHIVSIWHAAENTPGSLA